MKRRRGWLIAGVILLVFLALAGAAAVLYGGAVVSVLNVLSGRPEAQPSAPPFTEVVEVRRGDLEETVRVLGAVAAPAGVSLAFNSDWGQVAEVAVRPGSVVQAGDLIAKLDSRRLQGQVDSAAAALQRAQQALQKAQQPPSALALAQKRLAVQMAQTKVQEETNNLRKAQEVDRARLQGDLLAARQKLDAARLAYAQVKGKDVTPEVAALEARYAPAAQRCAELTAKPAPNAEDQDLRWVVCNETTDGADEIARLRLSYERELLLAAEEVRRAERAAAKAERALAQAAADPLAIALAENALAEAQARLLAVQEELAAAEKGGDAGALAEYEAAVQAAQRTLDEAQRELSQATLRAPTAGTVTRVGVAVGDWVDRSTVVAEIKDLSHLRVLAEVDETEIRKFSAGQPARVVFDALPGQTFQGRVELVPIQGKLVNDILSFEVPVQLEQWPAGLRLGMTAGVEVIIHRVQDVLLAPAAAIRQLAAGPVVALVRKDPVAGGRLVERRPVKVGRSNGVFTEILEGLQAGDQIEVQYDEAAR